MSELRVNSMAPELKCFPVCEQRSQTVEEEQISAEDNLDFLSQQQRDFFHYFFIDKLSDKEISIEIEKRYKASLQDEETFNVLFISLLQRDVETAVMIVKVRRKMGYKLRQEVYKGIWTTLFPGPGSLYFDSILDLLTARTFTEGNHGVLDRKICTIAFDVLDMMRSDGYRANLEIYESLFYHCDWLVLDGCQVLKMVEQDGIQPSAKMYEIIMMELLRVGRREEAIVVLDRMHRNGLAASNRLFEAIYILSTLSTKLRL